MARFLLAVAFVVPVASVLSGGEAKKVEKVDELKKLEGTWRGEWMSDGDTKLSIDDLNFTCTFKGEMLVIKYRWEGTRNTSKTTFVFTLDTSRKPHTLDATHVDGPDKGKQFFNAIYQLDDNELAICSSEQGNARPTALAPNVKKGHVLMVFKRVKK